MKEPTIPTHTFETEQSPFATSTPFLLVDWGGPRKRLHAPHRHAFSELIFIMQGGGRHEIDFMDYPIHASAVHFVKTAQVHLIDRTDDTIGCSLLLSDDFLHAIRQNINLSSLPFFQIPLQPIVQLDETIFAQVKAILADIKAESKLPYSLQSMEMIRAYCQILLLTITRGYKMLPQPETPRPKDSMVLQFIQLMEQRFLEHLNLNEYASILCLSANYLSELCKREVGKTAHQLLQERILLEAKRLLCYSDLPIKEIAYQLNFEDASYFSRFFKKHTTLSPADYRQSSAM